MGSVAGIGATGGDSRACEDTGEVVFGGIVVDGVSETEISCGEVVNDGARVSGVIGKGNSDVVDGSGVLTNGSGNIVG